MTIVRIETPRQEPAPAPDAMRRRLLAAAGLGPLATPGLGPLAAAGLGTLAAALPGCGTVGAPPAVPVDPPAGATGAPRIATGERWRYREVNGYNGETIALLDCVAEVQPGRLRVRRVDSRGVPRADEVYASAWQVIEEPFYDQVQVFDAALPLLPEPLAPGGGPERLRTQYRVSPGGVPLEWREQRRVLRWERIRVPAGELDALQVERRIFFVHADARRSQSVRTERLWYAPAVRRWARREWSGEYRGWPIRRGGPAREDWIVHLLEAHVPVAG